MQDLKPKLISLQEELKTRIENINANVNNRHTSQKFSEQTVDRQNDDVLLNLKDEAEAELEQINHALLKIERDLYGKCETCHKKIGEERISVLPFTPYCKNCAV